MTRSIVATILAVTGLGLALAGPASAGTPFVLGDAGQGSPTVTAGAPGVFHVVWNDEKAGVLRYCQIPITVQQSCSRTAVVPYAVGSGIAPGRTHVVVGASPEVLHLVSPQYAYNNVYVFTSLDGGQTFGGPVKIHKGTNGTDAERPLYRAARNSVVVPTWNPPLFVHESPLDGSGAESDARALLNRTGLDGSSYNLGLADVGDGVLATADDLTNVFAWRAPNGSDLNASPSWGAPQLVTPGLDSTMHGGPNGTFLAYTRRTTAGNRFEVRRWGGLAFGAPALVVQDQGYLADLYTSPNGTPGVVYRRNGGSLRYATSTDNGATFTRKSIAYSPDTIYFDLGVARDDNGAGVAVWTRNGRVLAADLKEVPDPNLGTTDTVKKVGPYKVALTVPAGCVARGSVYKVSATSTGVGTVRYVKFKRGGEIKQDSSPLTYSASFKMAKGAAPGALSRIQAAVRFKKKPQDKTVVVQAGVRACGG